MTQLIFLDLSMGKIFFSYLIITLLLLGADETHDCKYYVST